MKNVVIKIVQKEEAETTYKIKKEKLIRILIIIRGKCFERNIKECARPILVPGFFFLGKMVMM